MRFEGRYRHQSTRLDVPSVLEGRVVPPPPAWLSAGAVDRALRYHRSWLGTFEVRLLPVEAARRTGAFATDDALYYRDRFTPDRGALELPANLLDFVKLRDLVARRERLLSAMLSAETHDVLRSELGDPDRAAWEEYLCHEAGHGCGIDVSTKIATGFFRPDGRLAWPLVFAEEHRADSLSFGFALDLLDGPRLRAAVAFHLLHRFGLLAEGLAVDDGRAGLQPYLLFRALCRRRAIDVVGGRLALRVPPSRWGDLARALYRDGVRAFDQSAARSEPFAAAVAMARHVKRSREDEASAAAYQLLCVTTKRRLPADERTRAATQRGAPRSARDRAARRRDP